MSNFLAIATVTAALKRILTAAVTRAVPGMVLGTAVSTFRPNDLASITPSNPSVNIYLYQTTPNVAWRNDDLPTRRSDGRLIQHPQAALDLHYILTFYGDESQLEPQRLLGIVTRTLHSQPILSRQIILNTISDPLLTYLADSDLADQIDLVRFTPVSLSTEELSKIWSVLFQVSYTLSAVYQGTVVLIEGEDITQEALPVRERNVYAVPFHQPIIEQVLSHEGAGRPITIGSSLIIRGQRLRSDITRVRIGEIEFTPKNADVSDTQIKVSLLENSLFAHLQPGVHGIQVIHPMLMGTPPVEHSGVESNAVAFVLHPTITDIEVSPTLPTTSITLQINPRVGVSQRVSLLLNELNPTPNSIAQAYNFNASPVTGSIGDAAVFADFAGDPALDELGLRNATPIRGVLSGEFANIRVTNDPARIQLTIAGEGPHEISISGRPTDLDILRDLLETGINSAHTTSTFTGAQVIRVGNQLLILPGIENDAIAFEAFGSDPALDELKLKNPIQVRGVLSDDLTGFTGVTNDPARIELTIAGEGPHEVAVSGGIGITDLDVLGGLLESGIGSAHTSIVFKKAQVVSVMNRLLVIHRINYIEFPIDHVVPGTYLIRVQVDSAQSLLEVDPNPNNPRYINPTVTV